MDIKMENFRMPEAHRMEIEFKKQTLLVNDEAYVKDFKTPTLKEALLRSKESENWLDELKLHEGKMCKIKGSAYQVFATEVRS